LWLAAKDKLCLSFENRVAVFNLFDYMITILQKKHKLIGRKKSPGGKSAPPFPPGEVIWSIFF